MRRYLKLGAVGLGAAAIALTGTVAAGPVNPKVTFTKDVAPILFKRCVECHRPGEIAPMSLLTYEQARPWARSIKEKVVERSMPPWLADPQHTHFENDRRLPQKEIDTLAAWASAGAPKGDDKELPPAPKFSEGWTIGTPDLVLTMQEEFEVPAEGVVPYKYMTIPTNFTEDKWIQALEIRPGNRSVVHHVIASVQDPGAGQPQRNRDPQAAGGSATNIQRGRENFLGGIAPGDSADVFPPGTAKRIKAGSNIVLQMHYTTNGLATRDRTSVGFVFAKEPVQKTIVTGNAANARFVIPPGDPSHQVTSSTTFAEDVHLITLMPHMHVRGKDFLYTAVYPDGRSEVILRVPRYDFNWQLTYKFAKPLSLPKGTRIDCVAHFDNSTNNKYNPDPTREVRWGDQTWEEMMIGWFTYTRDAEQLGKPASTASVN
jgi:hypothetical protein